METILTRINLDIEEDDFWNTLRFHVATALVRSLSSKSNKVVILSHRGRPKGYQKQLSLAPFATVLQQKVRKEVRFLKHHDFEKIREAISSAQGGSIFLLENLRFLPGEQKNSKSLGRKLAGLGNRFINNDFATAHHPAASFIAITEFIPSYAGELLKSEIHALTSVRERPRHPFVLIIGGAKVKDKVGVIDHLLPKTDYILLGGGAANMIAKARGESIARSLYEPAMRDASKRLAKHKKIISPLDHVWGRDAILDIGEKTQAYYADIISRARTIAWAGPMGRFEERKFAKGTRAVAKAIFSNKQAQAVIGGAETVYSLPIRATKQQYGNVFLSTGGGAMLHFLAGKKLPALEVLQLK